MIRRTLDPDVRSDSPLRIVERKLEKRLWLARANGGVWVTDSSDRVAVCALSSNSDFMNVFVLQEKREASSGCGFFRVKAEHSHLTDFESLKDFSLPHVNAQGVFGRSTAKDHTNLNNFPEVGRPALLLYCLDKDLLHFARSMDVQYI